MADFCPFQDMLLVKIRLITPDPSMIAQDFTTLCTGYDPGGAGFYILGQGHNRTRFRRNGFEAVGPSSTPRWEIVPDDLARLPYFETSAECAARIANESKAKAGQPSDG